jgi:uncharacterized membrane protein YeaQ/YmgE (transglycosylase-associated protein family)
MSVIGTIFIGLIVGIVAKFIMPGRDPGGFIITTLLGIGGAFLARYIGERAGWYSPGRPACFVAAVFGGIMLLIVYRMLFGRRWTH